MKKLKIKYMISWFIFVFVFITAAVQGILLMYVINDNIQYDKTMIEKYVDKISITILDEADRLKNISRVLSSSDYLQDYLNNANIHSIYEYLDNVKTGTNQFVYAFFIDNNKNILRISNDVSNKDFQLLSTQAPKLLDSYDKTMISLNNGFNDIFIVSKSNVQIYDFKDMCFKKQGDIYICSKLNLNKVVATFDENEIKVINISLEDGEETLKRGMFSHICTAKQNVLGYQLSITGEIRNKDMKYYGIVIILFVEMLLLLTALLIFGKLLDKYVHKPIKKIVRDINRYNMFMRMEPDDIVAVEDIIYIYDHVVKLTENLKSATREVVVKQQSMYEIEIQKNDYKYAMLQSQINPHFLYNALNCIHGMAVCSGIEKISKICVGLCEILSYSLKGDDKYVKLSEEINIIKKYIDIMRIRFEYDFEVEFDVPECLMDSTILRMTMQPIVENAFNHGKFHEKRNSGRLKISANKDGKQLFLFVEDNGNGIEPEKLSEINLKLNNNQVPMHLHGLGIYNINSRLISEYGQGYGLEIFSENNRGCVVKIKFKTNT